MSNGKLVLEFITQLNDVEKVIECYNGKSQIEAEKRVAEKVLEISEARNSRYIITPHRAYLIMQSSM